MEVNGQHHTHATFPPGSSPRYPFCRRLGGLQSWSGDYGEETNLFPLSGIKPQLVCPAHSLVVTLSGLSWLLYPLVVLAPVSTIAHTVLEDICDKPIRIQSYCAVARLDGVWEKETEDLLREIQWINCARGRVAPTVQHRPPVIG
jgi:hypothetical protein